MANCVFSLAGRKKWAASTPPPRKVGDRRGANWNLFSKNSLIITGSSVIWPLPVWLSVIRPLHWLSPKKPRPRARLRKMRSTVLVRSSSSPACQHRQESPIALSQQFKNCSRYQAVVHLLLASRSLPPYSGSIQCSIRSATIRASRNSAKRKSSEERQLLRRTKAAQCLQSRGCLRNCRLAGSATCHTGLSIPGDSKLDCAVGDRAGGDRISHRISYCMGV